MLQRIDYQNREAWLEARGSGLGASEAAIVCGLSKWQTPVQLWRVKTGKDKPKDISHTAYVKMGTEAEEHLRALFMLQHPEYRLEYHQYEMLFQEDRPWLRATLDGELIATDGGRGGLEIKKAELSSKADWKVWDNAIPPHYLCQLAHQFLATGFDFIWLYAWLIGLNGNSQLRPYYFTRETNIDNMKWVLSAETRFWNDYVIKGQMPPAIINI